MRKKKINNSINKLIDKVRKKITTKKIKEEMIKKWTKKEKFQSKKLSISLVRDFIKTIR